MTILLRTATTAKPGERTLEEEILRIAGETEGDGRLLQGALVRSMAESNIL